MMHDRVTDHRHLDNTLARNACLFDDFADEVIQRRTHRVGHLDFATRIHHHIGDAAHQIFAEADLRVHQTSGSQRLAII